MKKVVPAGNWSFSGWALHIPSYALGICETKALRAGDFFFSERVSLR